MTAPIRSRKLWVIAKGRIIVHDTASTLVTDAWAKFFGVNYWDIARGALNKARRQGMKPIRMRLVEVTS